MKDQTRPVKHPSEPDTTEPVTAEASPPPISDHLTALGIETCIHCEGPRSAHRGPMWWCWERTTFFEAGPTRAQLTEALARAEAKVTRLYARGVDTTSALRDERDFCGNLSRLSIAVVEDCDAESARLRRTLVRLYDATTAYFLHNGAEHETEDCPEDDTCECQLVNAVNEAFAAALPLVEDKVSTPKKAAVQP